MQRPLLLTNLASGETRLVRKDCGGRPRLWLDEQTLVVETFGSGLNAFSLVDMRDGVQRPLLSAATRRCRTSRISPDGRWLAFDAATPGGSPTVAIAPLAGRDLPWRSRSGSSSAIGQPSVLVTRRTHAVLPAHDVPELDIRSVPPAVRPVNRSRRRRPH